MSRARSVVGKATTRLPAMNKLERAYAEVLEGQRIAGDIVDWDFEPERLLLADRCSYTPDFRVVGVDGEISFMETKGYLREDAWIKLKLAAQLHPYRFFLVTRARKKDGGGWVVREVTSRAGRRAK